MAQRIAIQSQNTLNNNDIQTNYANDMYLRWIANKPSPFDKNFSRLMDKDTEYMVGNFKVDLVERAYWTGDHWSDYWYYIRNHHKTIGFMPFIGAHWLSPFTFRGRIIVFYCGVCMSFCASALIEVERHRAIERYTCADVEIDEYDIPIGCEPLTETQAINKASDDLLYLTWTAGVGVIIYMTIVKKFAMCLCCQQKGSCLRSLGDMSGGLVMLAMAVFSSIMLSIMIGLLATTGANDVFWSDFWNAQWTSMIYDLVTVTIVFTFKWRSQRDAFGQLYAKAKEAQDHGYRVGADVIVVKREPVPSAEQPKPLQSTSPMKYVAAPPASSHMAMSPSAPVAAHSTPVRQNMTTSAPIMMRTSHSVSIQQQSQLSQQQAVVIHRPTIIANAYTPDMTVHHSLQQQQQQHQQQQMHAARQPSPFTFTQPNQQLQQELSQQRRYSVSTNNNPSSSQQPPRSVSRHRSPRHRSPSPHGHHAEHRSRSKHRTPRSRSRHRSPSPHSEHRNSGRKHYSRSPSPHRSHHSSSKNKHKKHKKTRHHDSERRSTHRHHSDGRIPGQPDDNDSASSSEQSN